MNKEYKILTHDKLIRLINNINKNFATKEIESEIINSTVSLERPTNQTVGDIWFVEQERN